MRLCSFGNECIYKDGGTQRNKGGGGGPFVILSMLGFPGFVCLILAKLGALIALFFV